MTRTNMVSVLFMLLVISVFQGIFGFVPVIIWGGKNGADHLSISPLKKISSEEFSDLLKTILKSQRNVVVFVQESLSPEDLVKKDANEKSAYSYLENELTRNVPIRYLPYVDEPLNALKPLGEHNFQVTEFNGNKKIFSKNSTNLFILKLEVTNSTEDRIAVLKNHDSLIHETCTKLMEIDDDALCVLTGMRSSWVKPNLLTSRHLLQSADSTEKLNYFKVDKYGLLYTKQPPLLEDLKGGVHYNVTFDANQKGVHTGNKNDGTQTQPQIIKLRSKASIENKNDTKSPKRLTLEFVFTVANDLRTWHLDNITLFMDVSDNFTLNSTSDINGRFNYSYHTPSTVIFSSPEYRLTFYSLQIELFNGNDRNSFSLAEDSVGFFTIPIWSGLFVTSLLVTIVLIGLSLIYDIKTMDQFDDPKGKPLTINASE